MAGSIARKLNSAAGFFIFLGIVLAANVLLSGFRWHVDLTHDKQYTLSAGTRELLGQLNRDITLKFYFSKGSDNVPAMLKQYGQHVQELLEEYAAQSKGKLTVESYDPKPDSDEEEWALRYGVAPQALSVMEGARELYIGLVAVSGAKESVIPALSPEQEPQLEYDITPTRGRGDAAAEGSHRHHEFAAGHGCCGDALRGHGAHAPLALRQRT